MNYHNSPNRTREIAVVAGAGPAGLTAALELTRQTDITPIVVERDGQVGGISKTICYRGNRMDLGGHRFFSKSDWVMRWWQEILPVEQPSDAAATVQLTYQNQSRLFAPAPRVPADPDKVMLVRQRISRIFHRGSFFEYPLRLNAATLKNLGLLEMSLIGASYVRSKIAQRTPEDSLEDFFINRFGERLYRTFFRDYTEKVWGVSCRDISAEWGAQRIKGLSVTSAVLHALRAPFRSATDTAQKGTETSLIERFLYPKFGPGQMWEEAGRRLTAGGGQLHLQHRLVGIEHHDRRITAVTVLDKVSGTTRRLACDYLISTLALKDLINLLRPESERVLRISQRLPYRDFVTVGLLVTRMKPHRQTSGENGNGMPPDNWIYIQEPHVKIGRLQIFNNWSPALVSNADTIWLGLEYFCGEGDEIWSMADGSFIDFAARELEQIGLIDRRDVLDAVVVRVPKAYPAYFGDYRYFDELRDYVSEFTNLYSIGRNGMHRYNNQDHSMLSANLAVESIRSRGVGKSRIWDVNTEDEYHEEVAQRTE